VFTTFKSKVFCLQVVLRFSLSLQLGFLWLFADSLTLNLSVRTWVRLLIDGWRRRWTLGESLAAFMVVLAVSATIYLIAGLKAPKPAKNREKVSAYACGEKVHIGRIAINITLYKYLVYFVILDASVLIIAFASLAINPASLLPLTIYLLMILAATLLLSIGGE
jgi:NADH:ubiquinone oxidoreductase subunit 3 (subunit A)